MNFLAHIYLSGKDEELMIGNFIADFVKGQKKNDYPERIKKGIELHRAIDEFTDRHPVTAISKTRLYPVHHKYAGAVVDIYYDHFLAKNFSTFSDYQLTEYTAHVYRLLLKNLEILPPAVRDFLPHMISKNWLLNYSTIEGIGRTLTGIGRRLAFENKLHLAVNDLLADYSLFESEFHLFFPQLINFAESKRE